MAELSYILLNITIILYIIILK